MSSKIGKPISRAEALALARQIMADAERERLDVADAEAIAELAYTLEELNAKEKP